MRSLNIDSVAAPMTREPIQIIAEHPTNPAASTNAVLSVFKPIPGWE